MSLLSDAVNALRTTEEAAFGEEAEYRRRDGTAVRVTAVPGRTAFVQRGEYGAYARVELRDFIVRREALASDPEAGDEIVFGGRVYEVSAPSGEPAWRQSDAHGVAIRVHTKYVGEAQS